MPTAMALSCVSAILSEIPRSSSRDLVLDALPHISNSEQLHPFQIEFLGMANELLDTVHSQAVEYEGLCSTIAADATTMLAESKCTLTACEEKERAACVVRDGCSASALHAEEAHARAEYEQSRSETTKARIADEKKTLELEQANSAKFMDGGWEGMDVHIVTGHLLAIGAEPALIAAVPQMLAVQVDQRGLFDDLTVRALTLAIKERADTVESMLKEISVREREAVSFALGAWAYAGVAGSTAASAAEQVANAEEALQSAKKELAQCSRKISAEEKAAQAALVEQTLAAEKVRQIEEAKTELRSMTEKDVIREKDVVMTEKDVVMTENDVVTTEKDVVMQPTFENSALSKTSDLPSIALVSPVSISMGGC